MIQGILAFFKIIGFFLNLKAEGDKNKAREKAQIGREIVDALAETNKARRISAVNSVIGRMRK